jgi:Flp pilus assembly protein TadD
MWSTASRRCAGSSAGTALAQAPLATLLDQVKENLRDKKSAALRAEAIVQSCDLILSALAECMPADHAQRVALTAKAHSRRGDALFLLGENEGALAAFDAALALAPADAYVLCNRGAALLALGRKDDARAEFTKAVSLATKKSGAHKLATEALAAMK